LRFLVVEFDCKEVVSVPHGLDENERAVQHQRDNPHEDKLRRLNIGPGTLVEKFGRTSVSVVSAANTANAALAP
jgi:hypothetical protein